jgi:hypothetical protein
MSALTTLPKQEIKALRGIPMKIENHLFVAVPVEILRILLAGGAAALPPPDEIPAGSVEAKPFMIKALALNLRAARMEARLTQEQLAGRMKVSQTRVSLVEGGNEQVSAAFVKRWLKACSLPDGWKPARQPSKPALKRPSKLPKRSVLAKVAARSKRT